MLMADRAVKNYHVYLRGAAEPVLVSADSVAWEKNLLCFYDEECFPIAEFVAGEAQGYRIRNIVGQETD